MASMESSAAKSASLTNRRDRPWLLPSNRKLRNLISISLRNVSFESRGTGRARRQTIDDDGLPQTLKSPAKIVAQREFRALEHSRSSEDLKSLSVPKSPNSTAVVEADGTPTRPHLKRTRRRSTLEWANATPQRRHERLERVTQERLADVFFSLHLQGIEEPIYVSEIVKGTMNPTFRHIDLSACGPGITRLDHVLLRIWVKHAKANSQWRALYELNILLGRLEYLGKNLDQLSAPLPQNAVVFHLIDGIYTTLTNFIPPPLTNASAPGRANNARVLPTSSFDALLRLSKLDDSIQDALAIRNKLATQLETLCEANKQALFERDQVAEAEDRLKTIDYARKTVEKQLEKARKQAAERRESLVARRKLMQSDIKTRHDLDEQMQRSKPDMPLSQDDKNMKKKAIQNQRRRICEDLQKIYPILPITGKSLAFTIKGLNLPNSNDLDSESPDTSAAALGYIAHVSLMLSYYLHQPLPYPVNIRGSSSTIFDPISLLKAGSSKTARSPKDERIFRTYPLFSRSAPRFRFEYAVFLLNKDIQLLLETAFNVRVLDIRQTLPNLKYLLYVATAGEGELPARKAGGVRGLVRARKVGGVALERSGSESSMGSTLVGSVLGGSEGSKVGNGKPKAAAS